MLHQGVTPTPAIVKPINRRDPINSTNSINFPQPSTSIIKHGSQIFLPRFYVLLSVSSDTIHFNWRKLFCGHCFSISFRNIPLLISVVVVVLTILEENIFWRGTFTLEGQFNINNMVTFWFIEVSHNIVRHKDLESLINECMVTHKKGMDINYECIITHVMLRMRLEQPLEKTEM